MGTGLPLAKYDSTLGQVVRREFHADAIARDDADEVLPHPAGNVRHDKVAAFNLDAESRVGEGLGDDALDFKSFFFLFFHKSYSERGFGQASRQAVA